MIYLDHNASTPLDPEVLQAMLPLLSDNCANPSSKHPAGLAAKAQVEKARAHVAELAGTGKRNIVFTSGATESAAIALHGLVPEQRVLVAASEHKCVIDAALASGATVEFIHVRTDGLLDHDHLEQLLAEDVAVVAVMAVNNETGVINDVARAAEQAHRFGALLMCDITQMLGKLPVSLDEWGVDIAIASAHKLYGPKGVGMLTLSTGARARIRPLFTGGGQERGLRGGTLNVAGIVGFGHACALALGRMEEDRLHLLRVRQVLLNELSSRTRMVWYGRHAPLVPNTMFVRFPGASSDAVLSCLPGVALSSGAACSADDDKPSHVLTAMGVEPGPAMEALRFSFGRTTTLQEVTIAAQLVAEAVERVLTLTTARKVS